MRPESHYPGLVDPCGDTYSLQDTVGQGLSATVGYEMRYIQCKCTGFLPRFGHALAWNFVTYNSEGKKVFNWPSLVGG